VARLGAFVEPSSLCVTAGRQPNRRLLCRDNLAQPSLGTHANLCGVNLKLAAIHRKAPSPKETLDEHPIS